MCILCEVMRAIDNNVKSGKIASGSIFTCDQFTFAVIQNVVRNAIETSNMYTGHGTIISMEMFTYKGVDIVVAPEGELGWSPSRSSADIVDLEKLMSSQVEEKDHSGNSLPSTAPSLVPDGKSSLSKLFAHSIAHLAVILVMVTLLAITAKIVIWAVSK